jgi:serine/threonine protein kinase
LKPENVLCFGNVNQEPGLGNTPTDVKLVIADAGHARVHETPTEYRIVATTTSGGTLLYSPPEAEVEKQDARTRRYDIWSLGCLYLEFLIWTLWGKDELEKFHRTLNGSFYVKVPKPALKPEVTSWIEAIRADHRCSPAEQTALGRLVDLIEKRLLIVNVKTPSSDSVPSGNNTGDTQVRGTLSKAEPPFVFVTKPTMKLESTEPSVPERAKSIEVCKEMNKIVAAAKKGDSFAWINEDGIERAARQGPPNITSYLSNESRRNSVTTTNEVDFTTRVRYRIY